MKRKFRKQVTQHLLLLLMKKRMSNSQTLNIRIGQTFENQSIATVYFICLNRTSSLFLIVNNSC